MTLFNDIYAGKTVLVTGHTGFKGAWLSFWLKMLGANVTGYSLAPTTKYSMYDVLGLDTLLDKNIIADIRDRDQLNSAFAENRPEIVFHLAAQPLVRLSYSEPIFTYETNVIGTLNMLEAGRKTDSVKAFVNITSDKCYENREIERGYKEEDPFGGHDIYSSSKGCAEILASSYRRSFLMEGKPFALATARAGNVIGGGDWALDRLLTDCIESLVKKETIRIRNPKATRPWQHVLEPLAGYLRLAQLLLEKGHEYAQGYNFGPEIGKNVKVCEVVQKIIDLWGEGELIVGSGDGLHEATLLQLDITKAKNDLGVEPVYSADEAIRITTEWYKAFYEQKTDMVNFTKQQIYTFAEQIKNKNIVWNKS